MEAMKVHYAKNIDPNEYDYNNEDDENEGNISLDTQENQSEDDIELIVKDVENIIYNSLFEYWDRPLQICLLATLLDPETRNNIINECRLQLHQLMNIQSPTSNNNTTSPSSKNLSPNNIFKELIFAFSDKDPLLW
ncbi:6941_t:CDS:2, partial [Gigaspora margarita]